jgi:hypothetical protein
VIANWGVCVFGVRRVAGSYVRSRDPATRNEPKQDPFTIQEGYESDRPRLSMKFNGDVNFSSRVLKDDRIQGCWAREVRSPFRICFCVR